MTTRRGVVHVETPAALVEFFRQRAPARAPASTALAALLRPARGLRSPQLEVPDTKDPEAFMDAWMEINRRRAVAVEEVQASDQQLRAYIATVNDADQRLRVDAGPSLSTLRSAKRGTPRPARRAALSWRPRLPRVRLNVLTAL